MARVVHLTTVHPPDDSRIFHKECRTLAAAGYEVILVAPEKGAIQGLGVQLRFIPAARSRITRIVVSTYRALRLALSLRAEVYHLHDPELLPVGFVLRTFGKRVVFDAHEDLPQQILSKPWVPQLVRRPLAWCAALMQWFISRMLSGVVAATPTIADRFPRARTVCVQNFPIAEEFLVADPLPYESRPRSIAYLGRVDRIRGAREMVLAMQHLDPRSSARLLIAGKIFEPTLRAELDALPAAGRIDHLGWLGRSDIASLLAKVRIGLVVLHPTPAYRDSYPIKLFEYMAAGVPVVASDFPLWRSIVEGAACGILVDPLDPHAIARAMSRLLDNPQEAAAMGQRGREAIRARYSWKPESEKLLALYARLCGALLRPDAAARAVAEAIPSMRA
jgi:glycosyltransferase involved in cell wall biosynthesis